MMVHFAIDAEDLLTHAEWRALVKRRAGYRCERCGHRPTVGRDSIAHHRDGDPTRHTLANGEHLCAHCHHREHRAAA